MKQLISKLFALVLFSLLIGCGGHAVVAGDGTATGGSVTTGDIKGEVSLPKK